ncbi:MAG: hypothetical protein U0841_13980 [Chloroflexia bacterium]
MNAGASCRPGWCGERGLFLDRSRRADRRHFAGFADVAAPTAPKNTVALSGQFPRVAARPANGLNSYLGPDWAAPVLPAALGFTLLRQASRSRRAAR